MSEQIKTQDTVQAKVKLFREKSLEAVESPESLNDYLQVTSPGVWLVLAAVIALLAGVILWGVFGRIDTKRVAAVVTADGQTACCVSIQSFDEISMIIERKTVEIDHKTYALDISEDGEVELGLVSEFVTDENQLTQVRIFTGLEENELVLYAPVIGTFADGVQTGQVVTETLNPISLLF